MARQRRYDYEDHWVIVNDDNTITIKPKYDDRRGGQTIKFGLGDAVIQINVKHPPLKIVAPITGESKGKGLFPPDPYRHRDLRLFATSITNMVRHVEGFNGNSADIHYPTATNGFKAMHAGNDVSVNLAGVGAQDAARGQRIEW